MNFDFISYQLNADISDFKNNIQYIGSDNGVSLYKAKEGFIKFLLSFSVSVTNLYFFEGNLITVYLRLTEQVNNMENVARALSKAVLMNASKRVTDTGLMYFWQDSSQFLGLMQDRDGNILLYHSLNKYNIYYQ